MKVVINDEYKNYKDLATFLENLDTRYRKKGRTLHVDNNAVRSFAITELGREIVVKRYQKNVKIQRLVYSLFKTCQAEKAYYNAIKLQALGIDTPNPIAFVKQTKIGLMDYCYFACEKTNAKSLEPLFQFDRPIDDHLASSLARFLISLHTKGILHHNLKEGNILYSQDADTNYHFTLVDNNTIEFTDRDLSIRERFENICKFSKKEIYLQIVRCYAEILGLDKKMAEEEAIEVRENFTTKKPKENAFWDKFKRNPDKKRITR